MLYQAVLQLDSHTCASSVFFRMAWSACDITLGALILQVLLPFVDETTLTGSSENNQCTEAQKPAESKRTFNCAVRDCEVLTIINRVVSDCFSLQGLDCGLRHQIVDSLCYSNTTSAIVPLTEDLTRTNCQNLTEGSQLLECPDTQQCPEFFLQYSPWGACSQSCPAEMPCSESERDCEISGTQSRNADCSTMVNDTIVPSTTGCSDFVTVTTQDCTKRCFNPLPRFTKSEGECVSSACDQLGLMSVAYETCEAGPGCQGWPGISSAQVVSQPCPAIPCDPCAVIKCSDPGTASKTAVGGKCQCACNDGYTGSRCHVKEGETYKVLSADGSTCDGILDIDGTCCDGEVDGCGYCMGKSVPTLELTRVGFDINGACCSGGSGVFLTSGFTCCGGLDELDECGVCRGSSDTCSKSVSSTLSIQSPYSTGAFVAALKAVFSSDVAAKISDESASVARRRLQQVTADAVVTLQPGVSTSAGDLVAAFVRAG